MSGSSEVIYVNDERIKKHFIRELEGIVDIHYHYDPRLESEPTPDQPFDVMCSCRIAASSSFVIGRSLVSLRR